MMISKHKKYTKGRIAKPPTLTRIEILTQGLMRPPDEVKANFSIKEDEKGRGVYLKIPELPKGSFVLEYEGDIINPNEVVQRESIYASNGEGCFIMEFRFNGAKMAIDATRNFDSYTRLLNHSRHPNIRFHSPIVVDFSGPPKPRIAAYALRDIKRGEEIVFDYGIKDRSIPWLKNRKTGFAEVSEDEFEEDDDSKDNESSASSDGSYLCLRYTAARAGRLSGHDHKPAFNYRELSKSGSSSSEMSQSSHHQTTKRKKYRSKCQEESLTHSGDKFSTSTLYAEHQELEIGELPSLIECGWKFKRLNNGDFRATFIHIGQAQKILKCLEPKRKNRKIEDVGSIICLSDESSPSQDTLVDSDPKELLDIPEVSSQRKVQDWQNSFCFEENNLNIKIVGVQSLRDSPEHVPSSELSYQTAHPITSLVPLPKESSKTSEVNTTLSESIPRLDLISSNHTDSMTAVDSSHSVQQLPHLSKEMLSQSKQVSNQPVASNVLPPSSVPMQQVHNATQGTSSQNEHCLSKPTSSKSSHPNQTYVNPDLSPSSTGSNGLVFSKPDQKPESPVTISDSEDQPSLPTTVQQLLSSSTASDSEQRRSEQIIYFSPRNLNYHPENQVATVMDPKDKPSTSGYPHHASQHLQLRKPSEKFIAKSQENNMLRPSRSDMPHISKSNVLQNHDSHPSFQNCLNPIPHHSQTRNPHHVPSCQPLGQQQNYVVDEPPQSRMLHQEKQYGTQSQKNYVSLQQHHQKITFHSTKNVSHENQKPLDNQQKTVNHSLLEKQPESFVISDDEDNHSGKRGDNHRALKWNSFNQCQSKAQDVLVLSSGDESDIEEIVPNTHHVYPSINQKAMNKSASVPKVDSGWKSMIVNSNTNTKSDESECELVCVEHSSQSASSAKRVAVIAPYKSEIMDSKMCQLHNALTDAEMNHLSEIFDHHCLSRHVSKADINEKIYKHWNFFRTILERGVSIEQIRAAVKQMCFKNV